MMRLLILFATAFLLWPLESAATPPTAPVVTSPADAVPDAYWRPPLGDFVRLRGTPSPGVMATVFPQPLRPGGRVDVIVLHPETIRVMRVRVDLGEGLPRIDERPLPRNGYTVTTVEIPVDLAADSVFVTIWLPGETLSKTLPVVRDVRGGMPEFGAHTYIEELPEVVHREAPVYPPGGKDRPAGTVMIQALVGTDGRVHDTRIVKSVPRLDQAAVNAVRKWRFKPALTNGKPVAIWVAVPVRFTAE